MDCVRAETPTPTAHRRERPGLAIEPEGQLGLSCVPYQLNSVVSVPNAHVGADWHHVVRGLYCRSSYKGRAVDALASQAEEGRGKTAISLG